MSRRSRREEEEEEERRAAAAARKKSSGKNASSSGKKPQDKKRPNDDDDDEEEIKKFTILGGIAGFILSAIVFVGIPYAMIAFVMPNYQEYLALIPNAPSITIVWTNLEPLFWRWLIAGIPMVLLATMMWSCRKGGRYRLLTSLIYLAGSIIWMVYVINFGNLADLIDVTVDGSRYTFGIVLYLMLYLLILFKALRFLEIYGKYKDARHKYLGEEDDD